jgi:hypothetical protein
MNLNQKITKKNDLRNVEIEQLKELHRSIKPEKVITEKIINSINKNKVELAFGRVAIVDLNLKIVDRATLSRVVSKFRRAGFKVNTRFIKDKEILFVKL